MDRHFRFAEPRDNVPVLAAFADRFYAEKLGCQTRGVFAYDERLRLLPSYLQQLEMESNGKSVTTDGQPVERPTAPIIWGGTGTDAQHAVFQLLHQGTVLVPVEFVAVSEGDDEQDPEHHRLLLLNAFAQGAALMEGRAERRSAPQLSRQPAEHDDPARPARPALAGRADRLLRAPDVRQCGAARHQPLRPVRGRARQGDRAAARGRGRRGRARPSTRALMERAGV